MSYVKSWTSGEEVEGGCPWFAMRAAILGTSILFAILGVVLLGLSLKAEIRPGDKPINVNQAMHVPTYTIAICCLCATVIFPLSELLYLCKLKSSRR